jgi:hypothetical protein
MIGNTVRGFIFDAGYTFGAHCKLKLSLVSRTKKAMIVDVMVNSIMWAERWEGVKRARAKSGAVVTRQRNRVDGNSLPRARSWPSK